MGVDLARPRWRTLCASVAGTAHARAGLPCADACAVRVLTGSRGESLLVAVAADGAGTQARAPEGARIACDSILEQAALWTGGSQPRTRAARKPRPHPPAGSRELGSFAREDVLGFVDRARTRIVEAAHREGLDRRAFSCTLLVALVDERSAVFFQVGDGAIVYQSEDGSYVPALWPQSGEYANCTWFLTDEDAAGRVQVTKARAVHELALLTDGLQGLALRFVSRQAHDPFFQPMFARLRHEVAARPRRLAAELRTFLDSPAVNQRTDDDKTLVLATRLPPAPAEARARR